MSSALLVIFGLVIAQAPSDTSKLDAKVHFDKAETHYRLGRFDQALGEYAAAYELFREPAFLFNLGQCHRNLQNWERAVFFFKSYLADRPDAPHRPRVEGLIAELEAKQAPPPAPVASAKPGARTESADSPALVAKRPAPAEEEDLLSQWWLWAIVGTVAVGTTVAIVVASQGGSGLPDDLPNGASVLDFRDR